jgi:NADH dehydrogenase FAD-containing subunit
VVLDDGERIEYDWLVVAVGTASSDIGVPGAKEHAIPLSSLEDAQRLAAAIRGLANRGGATRGRVAVVGSGLAGVELAGVVAERLKGVADVELMASASGIMASSPAGQRNAAAKALASAGVTVREGVRATQLGPATQVGSSPPLPSAASLTLTSSVGESTEDFDIVCWAVGQRVESPDSWPFPRDSRSKKIVTGELL